MRDEQDTNEYRYYWDDKGHVHVVRNDNKEDD